MSRMFNTLPDCLTEPVALITPALFSQPPPRPPGEEGVVSLKKRKKKRTLLALSLPAAGGEAGRERVGRVRVRPEGALATAGRAILVLFLALLALLIPALHAQAPSADWRTLSTPHFRVHDRKSVV